MAAVNKINKHKEIKTCLDIAGEFTTIILKMSEGCDENILVFDRYISNSLKHSGVWQIH